MWGRNSLHKVCHYAIYLDRTFNAAHYLQSIDRIHRLGLPEDVSTYVEIVEATDTIDNIVEKRLGKKIETMSKVLDDYDLQTLSYDPEDIVEDVRKAVYERMKKERERIAAKYRSEGEGEMLEIKGKSEKEEKQILSEAYREAQEIKGKADAEAIKIYAKAYSEDPEFYSFLKTLETYEENLGKGSIMILSTDSDYLKYLKTGMGQEE